MTERDDEGRKRARRAPWLLLGPGMLFLFLFFFFPLYTLFRMSLSYRVLWNALKKLATGCSDDEREALFAGTAARVYGC